MNKKLISDEEFLRDETDEEDCDDEETSLADEMGC